MNPQRKQRLIFIFLILLGIGTAAALVLTALSENINLFYTPTDVAGGKAPAGRVIRVGGLVEKGSVKRGDAGLDVSFRVTDTRHSVVIRYNGILPDLFREGQGIIAEGRLQNGELAASKVLAKHDENYMPREVVDALARQGVDVKDYGSHEKALEAMENTP